VEVNKITATDELAFGDEVVIPWGID